MSYRDRSFIPYGHQSIDETDIDAVSRVLSSDWLTTGPAVPSLEAKIAAFTGSKYCVVVNSGTSALDIAISSFNISKGSEVITTPFTFVATANSLLYNDLVPVFADIERDTRNINPESIQSCITSKTKAIITMDYAGHPCDYQSILRIAKENNLLVIEDACHAFGARYFESVVGSIADCTVFSFHPVKAFTTGEGGAVLTNNPVLKKRMELLRNHGIDRGKNVIDGETCEWAYDIFCLGRNYRLTDFQAALGTSQLQKVDLFIKRRQEIAGIYSDILCDIPGIEVPVPRDGISHAWHLYTVLISRGRRNSLYRTMKQKGIGTNVHYIPIYRLSLYRKLMNTSPSLFPITENVFSSILSLPIFPGLSDEDVISIASTLRDEIRSGI